MIPQRSKAHSEKKKLELIRATLTRHDAKEDLGARMDCFKVPQPEATSNPEEELQDEAAPEFLTTPAGKTCSGLYELAEQGVQLETEEIRPEVSIGTKVAMA